MYESSFSKKEVKCTLFFSNLSFRRYGRSNQVAANTSTSFLRNLVEEGCFFCFFFLNLQVVLTVVFPFYFFFV